LNYFVHDDDHVLVAYQGRGSGGKGFRDMEILTVRHGEVLGARVCFGWLLPHDAASSGFIGAGAKGSLSVRGRTGAGPNDGDYPSLTRQAMRLLATIFPPANRTDQELGGQRIVRTMQR
jgi:hypothetical protein